MSFTEEVVNRIATGWRARKSDRRSFLTATAVVGSALATHPWRYATTPTTAYASVCGEGAACDEGWSVFCCSINNGANQCPPGSFVGGWWKADHSGFCCGSARYYVDCNADCASDWKCHCGSGSCDQRRVACNQFRYGQCHQEISCYGPVVCRVVTCTPPWQFDRSCSATSLTDNRTVTHSAPCLPGNCPSLLTQYYYDRGGPGGRFGPITSAERNSRIGGTVMTTRNTLIYRLPNGTIHTADGAILDKYRAMAGSNGPLGEIVQPVTAGAAYAVATFQHGVIISYSGGTFAVVGTIHTRWAASGGLAATDLPVENQVSTPGGIRQLFRRGVVYAEPGATPREVGNRYFARYQSLGLAAGPLGFPTSDEVAAVGGHSYINFQHGRMYWSAARGAVAIHAPILADWVARGSERGPLGFPVGGQVPYAGGAQALSFEHGALFHSTKYGGHVLLDGFWAKWQVTTVAQHQGLGVPITDRDNGSHRSRITLNTARCCIHR